MSSKRGPKFSLSLNQTYHKRWVSMLKQLIFYSTMSKKAKNKQYLRIFRQKVEKPSNAAPMHVSTIHALNEYAVTCQRLARYTRETGCLYPWLHDLSNQRKPMIYGAVNQESKQEASEDDHFLQVKFRLKNFWIIFFFVLVKDRKIFLRPLPGYVLLVAFMTEEKY